MKDVTTLTQLEIFFMGMRRRWKLGLIFLALTVAGACTLSPLHAAKSPLFTSFLIAVIALGALVLFWLSSYIVVPIVRHQKVKAYKSTGAVKKPRNKISISTSRMLSPLQRLRAWFNLKTLKEASDYCFLRRGSSYLRVQWLCERMIPRGQEWDMIKSWDDTDRRVFGLNYRDEEAVLTVERVEKDGRERVYACWTPPNPTQADLQFAQTIELAKNTPVALAYEMLEEQPDGEEKPVPEMLCILTWIGDDQ